MDFRIYEVNDPQHEIYAHNAKEVYDYLEQYSKADKEIFMVLCFNAKNRLIECVPVSFGTVDCSAVYPREIIRECIRTSASSVILAHNHPTGDPEPSTQDKAITKRLVWCLKMIDIKTLDHIIIGQGRYYSFCDNGLIFDYERAFCDFTRRLDIDI